MRKSIVLATLATGLSLLFLPLMAEAAATDWPTYHHDNFRGGSDPYAAAFTGPLTSRWTSVPLGNRIYAEPLLVGNLLIVADLSNTVTALSAESGGIVWQTTVGTPVTPSNPPFPCGNVNPIGILGTPVVDPLAGIVYAVAMETPANYYLVGLDLQTGVARFPQVAIAPTGFNSHIQQQRSALTLANGMVYVPFGGFAGDCGTYHGWVVGVPATGSGTQVVFNDNPGGAAAAGFWATAGASADGSGNLYITSGNGFSGSFDNGNTIFKLSPTLGLLDWWAPSQWTYMNSTDTDLGSVGPAIVGTSNNLVFQIGKSGWGYLVSTTLSGSGAVHIGSELFSGKVCNAATNATTARDQVFGGVAYRDPYIYVPCPEGIKALKLAAGPTFSVSWSGPSFHPGPPIVAGGVVWAMDTNNGSLFGLNATTGVQLFHAANLGQMTHFTTPTAGQGLIYTPVGNQVMAFGQPRADRTMPLPAAPATTRSGAPPPVPQSIGSGRPSALIQPPIDAKIPSTLYEMSLRRDQGGDLLSQFIADLMRLF